MQCALLIYDVLRNYVLCDILAHGKIYLLYYNNIQVVKIKELHFLLRH